MFCIKLQVKGELLFDGKFHAKQRMAVLVLVARATRQATLSNIEKIVISGKKQSARTEKSINIGKTIQVSNFHKAAETDVNLTGRKQLLI